MIPTIDEALDAPGRFDIVIEAWTKDSSESGEGSLDRFTVKIEPEARKKFNWDAAFLYKMGRPYEGGNLSAWNSRGEWVLIATWSRKRGLTWLE